jgi:hypothetical protein
VSGLDGKGPEEDEPAMNSALNPAGVVVTDTANAGTASPKDVADSAASGTVFPRAVKSDLLPEAPSTAPQRADAARTEGVLPTTTRQVGLPRVAPAPARMSRKLTIPKPVMRLTQLLASVFVTGLVVLAVAVAANMLVAPEKLDGLDLWLGFIRRTDILATMVLTSLVTLCVVHWQRGAERRSDPEA